MISQDTILQVRDRANIVQVVGERVKLERTGRSLKGLCPFHKEKTPSFHVSEERNFYHCFGCHASGDSIRFIQETEGLSFVEAIRELAQRLGIEIQETRSDVDRKQEQEAQRRQNDLYSVNESAANYFERCLNDHPLREFAWQELKRRELISQSPGDETARALQAFKIGYAPFGWDGLSNALRAAGLSHVAAEQVGLLAPRRTGAGHYDRFRHRLMFAILDLRGRVIGFSGRSLPDPPESLVAQLGLSGPTASGEDPAKYINSPESPIYKKRDVVFGLYQARSAVRQQDECVLVEGNFDVVSLHARGIENVVAPLGTAFTQEQAALIRRYTQRVTLLFDADTAGQRASVAAREPCQAEGLLARVASLPAGQDPDDFVRAKGADALRASLKSARGMLEYLIDHSLEAGFSAADPQTQGNKIQQVLELIRAEQDPTVRALAQTHADRIATRLGIADARTMQALSRAVRQAGQNETSPQVAPPERARSTMQRSGIDELIVAAITEYPALLQDPSVEHLLRHVTGPLALTIATLSQNPNDPRELLDTIPEELRRVVAGGLANPSLKDEATARRVLLDNLGKLAQNEHKLEKAEIEASLREARSQGDREREDELLGRLQQLAMQRQVARV